MKGRNLFTQAEATQITELIDKKVLASSDKQPGIRAKIRRLGFYASDFGLSGGYTSQDFLRCVKIVKGTSVPVKAIEHKTSKKSSRKKDSDENYVVALCEAVLGHQAQRQYRFDFLIGDSGRKLPVDAYFPQLNLVVEYRERQHTEAVKHFDKPDVLTVSGVSRAEQRKIYDQRRREVLPKHGIDLVEISFSDFEFDSRKRIIRNAERDKEVILAKLKRYI